MSRLCHEPRVSLAVMEAMLAPYAAGGKLAILKPYVPIAADVDGDVVRAVTLRHRDTGRTVTCSARYVIDATELGDLLPLTSTEYVTGFEAQSETGEPSAPAEAQPQNQQAVSDLLLPSITSMAIMSSTSRRAMITGVRWRLHSGAARC
ncbi:FAD-dependent oxidoreductase [Devosia sp. A8/3-2]|nr:FAD-dependent oxidoreductase [Devosia sp. A8/3-2]